MAKQKKENIDLAEEHIKLAEDLVIAESKKSDLSEDEIREFREAEFALEKAESELEDIE